MSKYEMIYYMNPDAMPGAAIAKLFRKKVAFNTGGIEWLRPIIRRKYFSPGWKAISIIVTSYIKCMECLATRLSDVVVADSRAIKEHLEKRYKAKNVVFIPYGARMLIDSNIPPEREAEVLNDFGLSKGEYYLAVGRIVAENNIHMAIEAFKKSKSIRKLVIVGNFNCKDGYNKYLMGLRNEDSRIVFLESIYDKEILGIIRKNCCAYIHGYLAGGTTPSLLEQMLIPKPIMAYDVSFSKEVLQDGGIYFLNEDDLSKVIAKIENGDVNTQNIIKSLTARIEEEYNWESVTQKYNALLKRFAD